MIEAFVVHSSPHSLKGHPNDVFDHSLTPVKLYPSLLFPHTLHPWPIFTSYLFVMEVSGATLFTLGVCFWDWFIFRTLVVEICF